MRGREGPRRGLLASGEQVNVCNCKMLLILSALIRCNRNMVVYCTMSHLPNLSALSLATGVPPEEPAAPLESPNTHPAARHRLLEQTAAPLELLDLSNDELSLILSFPNGMSCEQIVKNCLLSKAFAAVCARDGFWRLQSMQARYDRPDRLDLVNGQRVPKDGSWRSHYQWWCQRKLDNATLRAAVNALRPFQVDPASYVHVFYGPVSQWDVSAVTDMRNLFRFLPSPNAVGVFDNTGGRFIGDISRWDVSNVQSFDGMFCDNDRFDVDISGWNVSSATSMCSMFKRCTAFSHSLASWGPKVSKVADMREMFQGVAATTLGLSNWDVSTVVNMEYMFASSAIQDDLSEWDVSNVTRMAHMFASSLFDGDISSWKVGRVRTMESMFMRNQGFNHDLSAWASRLGQLRDVNHMFAFTSGFTGVGLSEWDVREVVNMRGMFHNAQDFNEDLSMWYIGSSFNMSEILTGASSYQPPPGHHLGMRAGPPSEPWPDEVDGDGNVIHTGKQVTNAFLEAYGRMKGLTAALFWMRDIATDTGFHQILPYETHIHFQLSRRKDLRRFVHQHICRRAMLPGPGSSLPNGAPYMEGMKNLDNSPYFNERYNQNVRDYMWNLDEAFQAFRNVNGGNMRDATLEQWVASRPRAR